MSDKSLSSLNKEEEVPLPFCQKISQEIWEMKYANPKEDGSLETHPEAMERIAKALSDNKEHQYACEEILKDMRFLPAGRIQAGAGSKRKVTLFNCFLSGDIEDSMKSIMEKAAEAAETMRMGGGIGYDFSKLRPKGALIKSLDSKSSGPISFMGIFDAVCQTIASAGHRRGAQMGVLRCDHPSILDFIHAKRDSVSLKGFNISVGITNKFIDAVMNDEMFDLVFEGSVYSTVRARELWDEIMVSTWDWAEPGVLFLDEINRKNNLYYCETICSSNPCVTGDTRIATSHGLEKVEDLYREGSPLLVSCDNRVLYPNEGKRGVSIRAAKPIFKTSDLAEVFEVTTDAGYKIKCTEWHGFFLRGSEDRITRLRDMKVGDELLIQSGEGRFGKEQQESLALCAGFIAGDGYINSSSGQAVIQLWGKDKEYANQLLWEAYNALNNNGKKHKAFGITNIPSRDSCTIASTALAHLLEEHGFTQETKLKVPEFIWKGTKGTVTKYIQGLFETDGTVNISENSNTASCRLASVNKEFLEEVQMLLSNFGIFCTIRSRKPAGSKKMPDGHGMYKEYSCQELFELIIDGESRRIFMEEIGFFGERKANKYFAWAKDKAFKKTQPFTSKIVSIKSVGFEPVYDTTQEDKNTVIFNGIVTSQCSEQTLPPYGACLLGSFNLTKYLFKNEDNRWQFNFDLFSKDIPIVVRMMDNVVDVSIYPLEAQKNEATNKRRMGIGVTGLANTIEATGFEYGSVGFLQIQEQIMKKLANECYRASAELAKEKGSFPLYNKESYFNNPETFIHILDRDVKELIKANGIRNSHLISYAPTGTISLAANNVSSGIEPVFCHSYKRTIQTFEGPIEQEVKDYGYGTLGVKGKSTSECSINDHLNVLALTQKWCDSSVSKTCNIGDNVTFDEFKDVYLNAWKLGCKGITTFRAAGKRYGILNATPKKEGGEEKKTNESSSVDNEARACYYDPTTGKKECE